MPQTSYSTIKFEVRGHTGCVTLNRPEVLNAISNEMIAELAEVYATIETVSYTHLTLPTNREV